MNFVRYPLPVSRFAIRPDFDGVLTTSAHIALVFVGVIVAVAAIDYGQFLLAPVFLAIVIGLMFGPLADRIENAGIPVFLSAGFIVAILVLLILIALTSIAIPLSSWIERLPSIWARLQFELSHWKEVFISLNGLQEQFQNAIGAKSEVTVSVEDSTTVEDVAFLAPTIVAQIVVFLASFYFFVASRKQVRLAALSLCYSRRLRWRIAHAFRDIEFLISRYLMTIAVINLLLGTAVALAMWLLGLPSPILWGAMAALLNFVVYIGPAVMAVVLFGVGLATGTNSLEIASPPLVYLMLNFIEAQFVTPHFLGQAMTLNPFIVFLAITFWIWIWGPIGGFVAVPALLILAAVIRHIFPVRG